MESEIETLLEKNPNTTVDEMLLCTDFALKIRSNSEKVIQRLIQEDNLRRLFNIIFTTNDKKKRNVFMTIFNSNHAILHEIFGRSIPLSELALSCLDMKTPEGMYAAGLVMHLVSIAFDLWPQDVREVFRLSRKIIPLIIRNIGEMSVLYYLLKTIEYNCENVSLLLWYCFVQLAGYKGDMPLVAFKERNLNLRLQLTNDQKKNIIRLLKEYFASKTGKKERIDICFMNYIINCDDNDFIPDFLSAALEIAPNKDLALRCISLIKNFHDNFRMLELCLEYLTLCPNYAEITKLQFIILYVYTKKDITNLCLNYCNSLVRKISKIQDLSSKFKTDMKSIIVYSWIKANNNNPYLIKPFLIDASIIVEDSSEKWLKFKENVIDKWVKMESFDDFVFDENDYNGSYINSILFLKI